MNAQSLSDQCRQSAPCPADGLSVMRGTSMLVTGGTGFVGCWIAEMVAYLNDAHDFGIRLTMLSRRPEEFFVKAPHLARRDDILLIERDVRSVTELPSDVQWLIHAAATPDNRIHASDPVRTMETILLGTHAVLSAAARLPELSRMLHLSSGLVCGQQSWDAKAIGEHDFGQLDCMAASAAYAEAKRASETLCSAFRTQSGIPVTTARMFTFLGPYQPLDRPWAINNFISDALRGDPIRVQGDGETVRSYMYGSDLAFWLLRILAAGRVGAAYNVGSPEGIRLRDLASKIADIAPSRHRVELNTLGLSVPRTKWVPDVSLAREELGLEIETPLETALVETIAWNRAML